MNVVMVRAKVKDAYAEIEAAGERLLAALDREQPHRHASHHETEVERTPDILIAPSVSKQVGAWIEGKGEAGEMYSCSRAAGRREVIGIKW